MACKFVLAPSFPSLLERLLDDLSVSFRVNPLVPRWLVVPTSTLANHLRLNLGRQAGQGVLASVRVLPLLKFVRRLGCVQGVQQGERWSPLLDLQLFDLVSNLKLDSTLGRLKELSGGYQLLRPTFLDLADGGFGMEEAELLEELADEKDLTSLESATLRLYVDWLRILEQFDQSWEPLDHQRVPEWIFEASECEVKARLLCESRQVPEVYLYGFYDLTDINAQILSSLARRVNMTLFYPFATVDGFTHPAFHFGDSFLEDFRLRLGSVLTQEEMVEKSDSSSGTESFFLSTFPEGEVPDKPDFLSFQSASGVRAEAISAALKVRLWMDAVEDSLQPEEIMVVVKDVEPYLSTIRDVFASFAIPLCEVDAPVRLTPEQRSLHALSRICQEEAPAEWVFSYLREFPEITLVQAVDLDKFELKVREMGVWGGESWRTIIDLDSPDSQKGEGDLPFFSSQEKELVGEILNLCASQNSQVDGLFTPETALSLVQVLQEKWLPQSAALNDLGKALKWACQARPGLRIKQRLLLEMIRPEMDQIGTNPMSRGGVRFVPLMRARGLSCRAIVLLGLASGTLPSRIEEDPLLSDASRQRLVKKARDVGHRLPIKSQITDEMSMLFFLLNTSAQHVHWVIPESDETGRSTAPTPWVQRYIHHWQSPSQRMEIGSRVPRGPAQQSLFLLDLERDSGRFLPPDFLSVLQPQLADDVGLRPLSYLLTAQGRRKRELTRNGHIALAALPGAGEESHRIRVTELEVLARCPYRFYVDSLLKCQPLEPLEFSEQMNSLDWGGIIHDALEQMIGNFLAPDLELREAAKKILDHEAEIVFRASRQLPHRFPRQFGVLPGLFQEAAKITFVDTLRAYFEEVAAGKCSSGVPIEIEIKKGIPFPDLNQTLISGQIDRVDDCNGQRHVYDYKSGKLPAAADLKWEVQSGYRIQPLLYPWILENQRSRPSETGFSFLFLGERPPAEWAVPESSTDVTRFLKPFAEILKKGMYVPTPSETMQLLDIPKADSCRFCEYASLCRRFDRGASHRYLRFFREQLSSRLKALFQSGQRRSNA